MCLLRDGDKVAEQEGHVTAYLEAPVEPPVLLLLATALAGLVLVLLARRTASLGLVVASTLIAFAAAGGLAGKVLIDAGVPVSQVVEPSEDSAQFDSEALWERLREQDWRGARVRGAGAGCGAS